MSNIEIAKYTLEDFCEKLENDQRDAVYDIEGNVKYYRTSLCYMPDFLLSLKIAIAILDKTKDITDYCRDFPITIKEMTS